LNSPEMRLSTGKWNYVTAIVPGAGGADSIRLFIRLYNFEPGAVVYVDDVQLVELPNKASDNEGNK